MRKNTFLATLALFIAAVGVVIALAAYFKNRSSYLFDDDDDFDYYDGGEEEAEAPEKGADL
jgi:Na+/proline symporter